MKTMQIKFSEPATRATMRVAAQLGVTEGEAIALAMSLLQVVIREQAKGNDLIVSRDGVPIKVLTLSDK